MKDQPANGYDKFEIDLKKGEEDDRVDNQNDDDTDN